MLREPSRLLTTRRSGRQCNAAPQGFSFALQRTLLGDDFHRYSPLEGFHNDRFLIMRQGNFTSTTRYTIRHGVAQNLTPHPTPKQQNC